MITDQRRASGLMGLLLVYFLSFSNLSSPSSLFHEFPDDINHDAAPLSFPKISANTDDIQSSSSITIQKTHAPSPLPQVVINQQQPDALSSTKQKENLSEEDISAYNAADDIQSSTVTINETPTPSPATTIKETPAPSPVPQAATNQQLPDALASSTKQNGNLLAAGTTEFTNKPVGRTRILLGISMVDDKSTNKRLRVIRYSYLEYHKKMNTTNTVCTLPEVLAAENPEDCQLVFAFLYPGDYATTDLNKLVYISSGNATRKEHDHFVRHNCDYEEAVLLNTNNTKDDYTTILKWMKWSSQLDERRFGKFDYVAFATPGVALLPPIFWNQNQILMESQQRIFGGVQPFDTSQCTTSTAAPCLNHNFLIFSRDVAQVLELAPELPQGSESVTAGIWNLLQSNNTGNEIQTVPVKGVIQTDWPKVRAIDRGIVDIAVWDSYIAKEHEFKDEAEEELVRNSPAKVTDFQGNGRILIGILTTNLKPIERQRREAIRNSWVQQYANSTTPNRICSLQQLMAKQVPEEECQLAYTFVIGAASKGSPTERVRTNDTNLMVVPQDQITDPEPDVVYLNIEENMNKGKTDTWFHYAVLMTNTHYFDYVSKMDTDTVLIPTRFLDMLNTWPKFPNNVRIIFGDTVVKRDLTWGTLGAAYFNGGFYVMSTDLARYVTTMDRTPIKYRHEDSNIGNYINSNPKLINRKMLDLHCFRCRKHPVKRFENYPRFYYSWRDNPPREPNVERMKSAINGLLERYNFTVL